MRTDERTDMTNLIVPFRSFAKAPQKLTQLKACPSHPIAPDSFPVLSEHSITATIIISCSYVEIKWCTPASGLCR